jgi:hypothetical protein
LEQSGLVYREQKPKSGNSYPRTRQTRRRARCEHQPKAREELINFVKHSHSLTQVPRKWEDAADLKQPDFTNEEFKKGRGTPSTVIGDAELI